MPTTQDHRLERAAFIIETAQQYGVTFAIEGGRLAVNFPLLIDRGLWRQLQAAILPNKQTIARYVYSRERGLL